MKKVFAFIAILALVAFVVPVFAQVPEPAVVEDPTLEDYGAKSANKLGRGIGNVLFGWTQPIQDYKNNDGSKGPIQVWVEGAGTAIVRTAAGVAEIATSFIPSVEWEGDAEMTLE